MAIGSWLVRDRKDLERVLVVYVFGAAFMALGVILAESGVDWLAIQPIGGGLIVYTDVWISLPSGFYRSPEVASWHSATAVCLAVVLSASRSGRWTRRAGLGVATMVLGYAVLAAGRRKGLGEIFVFAVVFLLLQLWTKGRMTRVMKGAAAFVIVIVTALSLSGGFERTAGTMESMIRRQEDRESGGVGRRLETAILSVPAVFDTYGPFGLGLGTMTQGSYYFGANMKWGNSFENGPFRLAAELGLPGLAVFCWIVAALLRLILRFLKDSRDWSEVQKVIIFGLFAILAANAAVFLSAHQIFGDPFVFAWLGLLTGFMLGGVASERARSARPPRPVGLAIATRPDAQAGVLIPSSPEARA